MSHFAGVEGGTTGSRMVLLDRDGRVLARSETGQTNQWQIGIEACAARIKEMVTDCQMQAGIDGEPLRALGLGMSGLDTEDSCAALRGAISKLNLAQNYYLCNDTLSTLATATDSGGVVLIAGTGSNCLLVDGQGQTFRCGGWGQMLGDEGSAYSIAHGAMKTVADHQEGFRPCAHDTTMVYERIKDHFGIENRLDLLPFLYANFVKSKIADFAKKLAVLAREGDQLCKELFHRAGCQLGRHVQAVLRVAKFESKRLKIVCTGGVFNSFSLIEAGFLEGIRPVYPGDVQVPPFDLVSLKDTAAIGAAYLAAKDSESVITHRYDDLTQVFFSHEFK